MRIILSLNTDVTNILSTRYDVFDVVITQYFLAIQRGKKYYPNSEIILYTDEIGKHLFEGICTIKLLDKNNSFLFSEAKIEAITKEEVPFIHIDGDLFLDGQLRYSPNIDLLIDHDDNNIWEDYYKPVVNKFDEYNIKSVFPDWRKPKRLFCMGVAGFFNKELKDKYIESYYTTKNFYEGLKDKVRFYSLTPIVVEQYPLAVITHTQGYTYEFAERRSKYIHLYGKQKFYKKNVDWINKECEQYTEWKDFKNKLDNYDKNNLVFRYFTNYE